MLQYRLSTLCFIFFYVATTIALFGGGGFWMASVLLGAALCMNLAKRLSNGIALACLLITGGIICPSIYQAFFSAPVAANRGDCDTNLYYLGLGLRYYHISQNHFPPVYTRGKDGKPLFSWVAPLLVYINYDVISNALKLDEPWDSPYNAKCLSGLRIEKLVCPEVDRESGDFSSNYMAIIGPGTIWRNEGTVKISDLPDGGSHTVALVEVVSSGKHWAQPFALTAEEAIENMKTGKGARISTCHPDGVNVLLADGVVCSLPTRMPLSLWRKILAGDIRQDFNRLDEQIDPEARDMVYVYAGAPIHTSWTIMLAVIIWLISVSLLFFRAIASRKRHGKVVG
jgi:hypothetical protein